MAEGDALNRTASELGTIRSSKRLSNEKEVTDEPNILQVEDVEAAPPNAPAVTFTGRRVAGVVNDCWRVRIFCVRSVSLIVLALKCIRPQLPRAIHMLRVRDVATRHGWVASKY